MHYEIEQAGLGREHGADVGAHAEPERWHMIRLFDAADVRHVATGAGLHPVARARHGSWR